MMMTMMIKPTPAVLAIAFLLAGCSAPAAPAPSAPVGASLKESCDRLGPVLSEFGKVPPDAARWIEYLPKVRDVELSAEPGARGLMHVVADAFAKGASGEDGAVFRLAGAVTGLAPACKGAGSTALG